MHPFLILVLLFLPVLAAQQADLAAKSRQGKELMAAGKFREAADVYQGLNKAVPNNPGLLMNLGMARFMGGQPEQAIPPLKAALKLQPGIIPALLFLGTSYTQVGEPAKAIGPLEKVVAAQPRMGQARQALGDALTALDRFDEAAEQYREWAAIEPKNPRVYYSLGTTYEAAAQAAFEMIEKTAPESAYMLALVADVRETQKQYSSAYYLYRKALERRPDMRGLHAGLARVYRATGHPDWAAKEEGMEKVVPPPDCRLHELECAYREGKFVQVTTLARGKNTPEALNWRSQAFNQLALDAWSRLAALPPSLESHEMLAHMYRAQGRHIEAVKEWKAALKFAPNDPDLETQLAVSMHQSRDYKSARTLLEKLIKKLPDSAEVNFYLGDSLLNMQQPEAAVPYLMKAAKLNPDFLPIHSALGRALLQLRRGEEAIPHLKKALPLDDDGSLRFQLARAYQAAGDRKAAREMTLKYREIRKELDAARKALEAEAEISAP